MGHKLDAVRTYCGLVVQRAGITERPLIRGGLLLTTTFPARRQWRVWYAPAGKPTSLPPHLPPLRHAEGYTHR